MPAHLIPIASARRFAGKTTLAAALARWLHANSRAVVPLHCSTASGDAVSCPGGGTVSRPAAILAEACGLHPEPAFEAGLDAVETLSRRAEFVIVELMAGADWPAGPEPVFVEHGAAFLARSRRNLGFFPAPPAQLFLPETEELAGLPPYRPGAGRRTGVVSLPHLEGFSEFSLLRGMEWMTAPLPGRFGLIIVPASSSPSFDGDWMFDQGLTPWIERQKSEGCRVVSVGGWFSGSEFLQPGALLDYRVVSQLQGFRLPQPLPGEEDLNHLAEWFERHAEMAAWRKAFF